MTYDADKLPPFHAETNILQRNMLEGRTRTIYMPVKIYNIATEQEEEYRIVGSTESDPLEGKISDDCPLGKALLGQRVGDSINVETPGGIVKYTVISISK